MGPDSEDMKPLFMFTSEKGELTGRWLVMGGFVSHQQGNPEEAHLKIEILDASGNPIWERDITRQLSEGETHHEVRSLSDRVPGIADGAYTVRLRTMGSGILLPEDHFFVVAIDMDDEL